MSEANLVIYIAISFFVFIILIVIVIWFFNFSQKKLIKAKLLEQENEIKYQNQLLETTVSTQEAERERIAKELHDDVTSKLNIIHLNVHMMKKKFARDDIEFITLIDQIETSLQDSITTSREIAHDLIPIILLKFGIHHAISELITSIGSTGIVDIQLLGEENVNIRNNLKHLHIYRILQELFNNTLKYADAQNISVTFAKIDEDYLSLTYKDDGNGYDADKTEIGLGSLNIQTRLKLLGGKSTIYTSIGNGFLIEAKFPNYD